MKCPFSPVDQKSGSYESSKSSVSDDEGSVDEESLKCPFAPATSKSHASPSSISSDDESMDEGSLKCPFSPSDDKPKEIATSPPHDLGESQTSLASFTMKDPNEKKVQADRILRFSVKDYGKGFDFENLPDPTAPENIEKENGVFLNLNTNRNNLSRRGSMKL